jgi:hypothetical protein
VTCAATEISPPCSGSVKLETKRKLKRGKRVKLAEATFALGAGETQAIALQLSPRKAALIRAFRKSRKVIASANAADAAGNTTTATQGLKLVPRR